MYIIVDIGGSNTRIAKSDSLTYSKLEHLIKISNTHSFEEDFQNLVDNIQKLSQGEKLEAVGIGFAGEFVNDIMIDATNLPEWNNFPIKAKLEEQLKCKVFAANDGLVACLGEAFYGQGVGKDFLYITWGTGIGGATVRHLDDNLKIDIVTWLIYFEEWESNLGGRSLEKKFNKHLSELNDDEWNSILLDFGRYTEDLCEKLNFSNVIFGGGVTDKQKERLNLLKQKLISKGINLLISEMGDNTGLYGALGLIKLNS